MLPRTYQYFWNVAGHIHRTPTTILAACSELCSAASTSRTVTTHGYATSRVTVGKRLEQPQGLLQPKQCAYGLLTSYSTDMKPAIKLESSILEAFLKTFGFSGFTKTRKSTLYCSAARLYVACSEYSDFKEFSSQFHLDDTFSAWVQVVQLHMWMMMVRLRNHSVPLHKDYKFVIYHMNKSMWTDLEKRSKKLASGSIRKDSMIILGDNYKALVIGYDEGYFTDDKVLAGALWRNLLNKREDVEPDQLMTLVNYVHKNLAHLERHTDQQLLIDGHISFLPLHSDTPDIEKDRRIRKMISYI